MHFAHETLPQRVIFATGESALAVAAEVAMLGSRVMLIASPQEKGIADPIAERLPVVLRHDEVVMHVPVAVAERARQAAVSSEADVIVTVGGGSTTGLGKAIALTNGLPIVAVPSTFAGSEATNVWGLTEEGTKSTGVDRSVLPRSVVYDASLLLSLPRELAVASGLNALAHCVDSMWGPRTDPMDQAMAEEGIRALSEGLSQLVGEPSQVRAIEQTLYGAYLAAVSFASAGSGMHHKICHVLGGMFNLPHAQTHAVVLPHVLAFNSPNAPESERRIARAFGAASGSAGLAQLRAALAAPSALRDYGMPRAGIEQAVGPIVAEIPDNNPTPVTREKIASLLQAAWSGEEPT